MTGYTGGDTNCNAEYTGSHMCTQTEVMSNLHSGVTMPTSGSVWVSAGGAKYAPAPKPVNDCNGWTDGTGSAGVYLGNYWIFNSTGGSGQVTYCDASISLACCE